MPASRAHPTFASTDPRDLGNDVNGNLNGAYYCAHAVLPGMQAKGGGSIVNIGSVNGLGALGDPAYSAAKAGMITLTKSLAMEYGPLRHPRQHRAARHGAHAHLGAPRGADPTVLESCSKWYPLGRIVEPIDVAKAVAFLASDAAARDHRRSAPGRLRADRRQHRDDARADARGVLGRGMDRLRIGVIGLGWFGEIHCEAIVGIPNLELAALCTRTAGAAGRAWRRSSG